MSLYRRFIRQFTFVQLFESHLTAIYRLLFVAQYHVFSVHSTTNWFARFVCQPLRWAFHHLFNSMYSGKNTSRHTSR